MTTTKKKFTNYQKLVHQHVLNYVTATDTRERELYSPEFILERIRPMLQAAGLRAGIQSIKKVLEASPEFYYNEHSAGVASLVRKASLDYEIVPVGAFDLVSFSIGDFNANELSGHAEDVILSPRLGGFFLPVSVVVNGIVNYELRISNLKTAEGESYQLQNDSTSYSVGIQVTENVLQVTDVPFVQENLKLIHTDDQ